MSAVCDCWWSYEGDRATFNITFDDEEVAKAVEDALFSEAFAEQSALVEAVWSHDNSWWYWLPCGTMRYNGPPTAWKVPDIPGHRGQPWYTRIPTPLDRELLPHE